MLIVWFWFLFLYYVKSFDVFLILFRFPLYGEFQCQNAIIAERFIERGSPYVSKPAFDCCHTKLILSLNFNLTRSDKKKLLH